MTPHAGCGLWSDRTTRGEATVGEVVFGRSDEADEVTLVDAALTTAAVPMALMLADFSHAEEAAATRDAVDSLARRQHRDIPILGIVCGDDVATTTGQTRPGVSMGETRLHVLARLSTATPAKPGVSGVVWGLASGVGRASLDNPAMWALARRFTSGRPMLGALADAETIAAAEREAAVPSSEVHGVPQAMSLLVSLMADLSVEDLTRRPVAIR